MQLKIVVLPAPLGPMRPTISTSPTRRLTSLRARRPPKRMETRSVSRTDIGALRSGSGPVVGAQRAALQPLPDGGGDGAQAVGLEDEGDDGEHAGQGLDEQAGP